MARQKIRVTGIAVKDQQLLLIRRIKDGSEYWVLPGGGVEDGETEEQGFVREIIEETSCQPVSYKLIDNGQDSFGDTVPFYSCQLSKGELVLGGPEKEKQNPNNQYHLTWVDIKTALSIKNIYPMFTPKVRHFLAQNIK